MKIKLHKEVEYISKPDFKSSLMRRNGCNTIYFESDSNLLLSLKEELKDKPFFIETHGCQANLRDEETISGILTSFSMRRVNEINEEFYNDTSIIIINTCSVRENANNKVYAELGNLKKIKRVNKNLIIILTGCMTEIEDTLNILLDKYFEIDIILGTHNISSLEQDLAKYLFDFKRNKRIVDVSSKEGDIVENLPSLRNSSFQAYVNISFGCDKFCTYCVVPMTRGKERSRRMEDILKECQLLKEEGYKEITLLGQNVDSYGKDLDDPNITFHKLLEEVAKLNIPRIRFLTSYPSDFKDEVIDVIAKYDNIMNYIHLPVQSGSSSCLKRMNRRYNREEYLDLVKRIKKKIPTITLSSDIIVGFPNETEEEFKDTLSLVQEVKYGSCFTFIYSPRKNTVASKLDDKVSYETKVRRFKELTNELEKTIKEDNKKYLNKEEIVLVTQISKKDKNNLTGTLESNKIVNFKGDPSLIGTFVKVKILEDKTYSFLGELVKDE